MLLKNVLVNYTFLQNLYLTYHQKKKCYLMTQKLLELLLFSKVVTVLAPISVFPCFSHRFPKYLRVRQMFNLKSLVFQAYHSTGQSIIQIVIKNTFFCKKIFYKKVSLKNPNTLRKCYENL